MRNFLSIAFVCCAAVCVASDHPRGRTNDVAVGAYVPPDEPANAPFSYYVEPDGWTDQGVEDIPTDLVTMPRGIEDLPPMHGRFEFADRVADFYNDAPPQDVADFILELCALPPLTDPRVFADYYDALHDYFENVPGGYHLAAFAARQAMASDPHEPARMIRAIEYELGGAYDGFIDYLRIDTDLRAIHAADPSMHSQIASAQLLKYIHGQTNGRFGNARIEMTMNNGPQLADWPSVMIPSFVLAH